MPILEDWELKLTTDDVLRAQGTDPEIIRTRRPALVTIADKVLTIGLSLIHPVVLYQKYRVSSLIHERLELSGENPDLNKHFLSGSLIVQHLANAQTIFVMLCTIGKELENYVSRLIQTDPLSGLALDSVGSAAAEMLAIQACNQFEKLALADGMQTTLPLNPGMIGWPVSQGQPQIFSLLDSQEINVSINTDCMMTPRKSLSLVLGVGENVSASVRACDYCSLNGICKYQNHYAK
jgi:hypothetical protein